jgi:hypothetical protein
MADNSLLWIRVVLTFAGNGRLSTLKDTDFYGANIMNPVRFFCVLGILLLPGLPVYAAEKVASATAPVPMRPVDNQNSSTISVESGFIITGPENASCTGQSEGAMHYSVKYKTVLVCDGKDWKALKTEPLPQQ